MIEGTHPAAFISFIQMIEPIAWAGTRLDGVKPSPGSAVDRLLLKCRIVIGPESHPGRSSSKQTCMTGAVSQAAAVHVTAGRTLRGMLWPKLQACMCSARYSRLLARLLPWFTRWLGAIIAASVRLGAIIAVSNVGCSCALPYTGALVTGDVGSDGQSQCVLHASV